MNIALSNFANNYNIIGDFNSDQKG